VNHPFFKNHGPFNINDLLKDLNLKNLEFLDNDLIYDIKDLQSANTEHLTFFHSKKYHPQATETKGSYCITLENLSSYLPKNCKPIIVENVLLIMSHITSKFYPDSINDDFDNSVKKTEELNFSNNISFGKNVLIGDNVQIGENCLIGHNTIIEKNVKIGSDCSIGSNVIIRNSIIEKNVRILDSCVIGKKGFGFFPNKKINLRYPHIGIVVIGENSEIGSGTTIDRGSMSNTIIGKNTFLDNLIHIAHNNKIGDNCIIAGQVGFAGSSIIGNNVMIGGQAGISGHLKIGNNVQIGGGSGVIRDISDNSKVMGYPSKDLRKFLKENK
jgi:UDP-3-O-[3-hydroxymyristoyl] glucosamine N-acyltransferase